jgi:hypothetical protein
VVYGLGPYIRELFEAMNLVRILDITDSLASALAKLAVPTEG